jgi:hypothetical protein
LASEGRYMETLFGFSNQARFVISDRVVHEHQGLRFRSITEIRLYDALVKRRLLVFPLPLAVLGDVGAYREPDFLVFSQTGRSGILEIHGAEFHPPETAALEHERRRRFIDLGINEYEIYDAAQCYNESDRVVSDFLARLKRQAR